MADTETVPIDSSILLVRGHRVILATDLAKIYGVETRVSIKPSSAIGRDFRTILHLV